MADDPKSEPKGDAKSAPKSKPIRVRAVKRGFYDHNLRDPGTKTEEFTIRSEKELGSWMERIDEPK